MQPGAVHTPPLIRSSRQQIGTAIEPHFTDMKTWRGEATGSQRPPDGGAGGWILALQLLAHPCGALCRRVWRGRQGALLRAGPCLQAPPWSACPPGSTATCAGPCWSPAPCTAPSPSSYSCGGKGPSWARSGTSSEWPMAGRCLQPRGFWGPDALEGPKGSGWRERDLWVILSSKAAHTSQCGQGWARVVPEVPTAAGLSPMKKPWGLP